MRAHFLLVLALVVSNGALAQNDQNPIGSLFSPLRPPQTDPRDDPGRRRLAVPSIRAATDCIARETLADDYAARAYKNGGSIASALANPVRRCSAELLFMMSEQDRIYGYGSGRGFFEGPYKSDLERAVLARIKPDLDRRSADIDREDARRKDREAEEDARRRAETARLEAQRQADVARAEMIKRERLEAAQKSNDVLRERMFACLRSEVSNLVRSGETASVVAGAVLTLCNGQVDQFLDGFVEQRRIEGVAITGMAESLKAAGRERLREEVLALTVRAKAGN